MNTQMNPEPPELTVGSHLVPEDGACLMEWVSVLAGEPWSDAPAGTDPLIAHLARLVNDAISSSGRHRLLPLAHSLAHLRPDPDAHARVAAYVTGYAMTLRPSLRLAWMHTTAERHLRRHQRAARQARLALVRQRVYSRGPAPRALEVAVAATTRIPDPDRHLVEILSGAIARMAPTGPLADANTDTGRAQ